MVRRVLVAAALVACAFAQNQARLDTPEPLTKYLERSRQIPWEVLGETLGFDGFRSDPPCKRLVDAYTRYLVKQTDLPGQTIVAVSEGTDFQSLISYVRRGGGWRFGGAYFHEMSNAGFQIWRGYAGS